MDWNLLNNILNKSKNIVLSTHVNPDGDGLGSQVAMYYYLKSLDKDVKKINISKLPDKYTFLNNDNIFEHFDITQHSEWIIKSDCSIIFDIGNYKRLGEIAKLISENNIYAVSIDHHPSDDTFFDYKFLDITSPATGFLVWQYF